MTELNNKTYIVTGASKGFGLAISKALINKGANVGMLARNPADVQNAAKALGNKALGLSCDIGNKNQIHQAFDAVIQHFGQLDGLINNAGLARPGSVENIVQEELLLQVNTNFVGTVLCCQAVIPRIKSANNPRIINISSASAWHYDEMLHLSIYAATKAAVERFTRDLRNEVRELGIGVSCIRPGNVMTEFAAGWNEQRFSAGLEAWHNTGPTMDTGMEVEDVANAVVQCLEYPPHVAVDLMEIRPNKPVPKVGL